MDSTRDGVFLLAVGCIPFAGGALLTPGGAGTGIPCPFRAATGLPCPLCGATRAFTYFMHGDGKFVDYNAPWIPIAALFVVLGLVCLLTRRPLVSLAMRTPPRAAAVLAAILVVPWIYALAERATIIPT
jgi:hypothetical protein